MHTSWRGVIGVGLALTFGCGKGPEGPAGPAGPAGPPGLGFTQGASISDVTPSQVVAGQEYDVTLSGFATAWTDTATVVFGDGIRVTRTKAASSTSLVVHVAVAPNAKADTRDLSVNDGMTTVFWRNAFTVLPREQFTALGVANQLSVSVVRLTVNEPDFELSGSSVDVTTSPALTTSPKVLSVSAKSVEALILADIDAGVGAYDVTVTANASNAFARRSFTGSQILTVTPAQITPFDGTAVNVAVDKPFMSDTYSFAPATDAGTLIVSVTSSIPGVTPRVSVIPSSGLWADANPPAVSVPLNPLPNDVFYLVVFESTGATGFSYTLEGLPVPHIAEEEPNDMVGQALALPLPGEGDAQLSSTSDVDIFKVTVGMADVGKKLHVVTLPGDTLTDTVVEILLPDGMSTLTGPIDWSYQEDVESDPLPAAGEYYVKISMSTFQTTFDPAESHYEVLITLE